MNQNDYLRFSQDKYIGRFKLDDFKSAAEQLEKIVKSFRSPVDSRVLTCEDSHTYNWSNVSIPTKEGTAALNQRQEYALADVDNVVWDKSYKLQLTMKLPEAKEPFMVCLTHDKDKKNKLFFYGQVLDEQTHHAIMDRFHKRGLLYKLGDGFEKVSTLNILVAMSRLKLRTKF